MAIKTVNPLLVMAEFRCVSDCYEPVAVSVLFLLECGDPVCQECGGDTKQHGDLFVCDSTDDVYDVIHKKVGGAG